MSASLLFNVRFSPAPFEAAGDLAQEALPARDTVALLRLMATLGAARHDPRNWRLELLGGLNQLLPANVAAAFTLKDITLDQAPVVTSLVDAGFKSEPQRQAFLREFNAAPFGDPFSRLVLRQFAGQQLQTLTCLRSAHVHQAAWNSDPHVLSYRRATGLGDCIMSLHRGGERGSAYALLAFRSALSVPAEGGADPGTDVLATAAFQPRDRLLLDLLHRGLDGLYRAEEATQKINRASTLRPRLRETLDLILSGDTERQVAERMNLSVHTVHDYVKSIYAHFGVSSRAELLARWVQDGGQIPPRRE